MDARDYYISLLDEMIANDPELFNKSSTIYKYGERKVPRVTSIITRCIHEEKLMHWCNYIGLVKKQKFADVMAQSTTIGTQAHACIDAFLSEQKPPESPDSKPIMVSQEAKNAYLSFRRWYSDINKVAKVNPIFHEHTLVCKYWGGTCDGVFWINGKKYLVDYKTSNHIGYAYLMQVAAYAYMLELLEDMKVDGCIVLQLSKTSVSYNEYVINTEDTWQAEYLETCKTAFFSLAAWYYNLAMVERDFGILNWGGAG